LSTQEQLLREVERRHQEKALADTACEALEGKLRKAEDEMHDLLVRGVGGGHCGELPRVGGCLCV